jgi:hypothetical protein
MQHAQACPPVCPFLHVMWEGRQEGSGQWDVCAFLGQGFVCVCGQIGGKTQRHIQTKLASFACSVCCKVSSSPYVICPHTHTKHIPHPSPKTWIYHPRKRWALSSLLCACTHTPTHSQFSHHDNKQRGTHQLQGKSIALAMCVRLTMLVIDLLSWCGNWHYTRCVKETRRREKNEFLGVYS